MICTSKLITYLFEDFKVMKKCKEVNLINLKWTLNLRVWKKDISIKAKWIDGVGMMVGVLLITLYLQSNKHWFFNNLIAIIVCSVGITSFNVTKFSHGAILLFGAFIYDIFWVFQTSIMVEVAQALDLPAKLILMRGGDGSG